MPFEYQSLSLVWSEPAASPSPISSRHISLALENSRPVESVPDTSIFVLREKRRRRVGVGRRGTVGKTAVFMENRRREGFWGFYWDRKDFFLRSFADITLG